MIVFKCYTGGVEYRFFENGGVGDFVVGFYVSRRGVEFFFGAVVFLFLVSCFLYFGE